MKKCSKCRNIKPFSEFYKDKSKKDKHTSYCKICQKGRSRLNDHRITNLKRHYNLTLDEYDKMFEKQNGVCAICNNPELICRLSVDHDHETGQIRGLLCKSCNARLGVLEDAIFTMKAKNYLKGY